MTLLQRARADDNIAVLDQFLATRAAEKADREAAAAETEQPSLSAADPPDPSYPGLSELGAEVLRLVVFLFPTEKALIDHSVQIGSVKVCVILLILRRLAVA